MPNHKSAEKRMRQNERRRMINRGNRSRVRTSIKNLRSALGTGDTKQVSELLRRFTEPSAVPPDARINSSRNSCFSNSTR